MSPNDLYRSEHRSVPEGAPPHRTTNRQRQDQRDDYDRRRRDDQLARVAERQEIDEQVRLRHLAEDEERRRRRVFDLAQSHLKVEVYRCRADPARRSHLVVAREEVERAERLWQEADEVRRRWPSRWPW